jgi:hypothetical protein
VIMNYEEMQKELESMIRDYRLSITCGMMGMDLDMDLLPDIRAMKTEELDHIIKQLDYWTYIFKDILESKKA